MHDVYPAGPASVPADLTRPTRAYRRHAYLAVTGLLVFVALYFGLAGWFAWTAFRLLSHLGDEQANVFALAIGGVGAGFLAVFMLKAVVFVRRGRDDAAIEIKAAEHPRLFAFLHRVADEARAPRPHRVFLSPRVNAGVFYDLSIANLILPSKKNLEIGLGLINVLSLGELKAVLAHEFGHFAQRTMAVGRWVYVAQQIAGHIVVKRDALDRFLQQLSGIDIRLAWIGWGLRIIVWSIRSLVDTLFGWVVLSERALSREMEFQADLVAVSLTGSDALIHALLRLEAADDAMDRALAFAGREQGGGRAVADLFAVQARILEHKRTILADPTYGQVPSVPVDAPEAHRVFKAKLAHPPRMWATHPPSELREHNAKRTYVAAPLDDRSSWLLFDEPERVRAQMTAHLYDGGERPAERPLEESLAAVDKLFGPRYFDPAYRGVYLGRSVVRGAEKVGQLYGAAPGPDELAVALEALYPASLTDELARLRELSEEKGMLAAVERGILEAPGRIVRHRGQERHRRELPALVAEVERDLEAARQVVAEHDRRVRAAHLAAARALSPGWEAYLRGLLSIVHYADHRQADLDDARGALANVVAVVTADRKVTSDEIARVVRAADDVQDVLEGIYRQADQVVLGAALAARLEKATWAEVLDKFELGRPHESNISGWLDVVQSWVSGTIGPLSALSSAALDELVRAEEEVARLVRSGEPAPEAPEAPRVPARYDVLLPGRERQRQTRLGWWDRFQVADGFLPGLARFAVAAAIVGGVLMAARSVGRSTVVIINGLSRSVVASIGGRTVEVAPQSHREVAVDGGSWAIAAHTDDGALIESFSADIDDDYGHYIYDVAQAAPLVEWDPKTDTSRPIGVARWRRTDAQTFFDEVGHVSADRDGGLVVVSLGGEHPDRLGGGLSDADVQAMIAGRARWEPADAPYAMLWLAMASERPDFTAILTRRFANDPDDIGARRFEQDTGARAEVCARHTASAAALPDDPGAQYLGARCLEDRDARDEAFLALDRRWPEHGWIAFAAALVSADKGDLADAAARLESARRHLPPMRDFIADRLARLRRLLATTSAADLSDLLDEAPRLRFQAAIESGAPPGRSASDAAFGAFRQLHRRELAGAVDAAGGSPVADRVLVLAAASDRAPPALVEQALAVPVDRIDADLTPFAFALAVRAGRDPSPYLAPLRAIPGDDSAATIAFLEALRAEPTKTVPAELHLAHADLKSRALALAAGVVMLGDQAPPQWRDFARKALFATERPPLD